MTDFPTILAWLFHGLIQYILIFAPYVSPYPEASWPPAAWWMYNSWNDWFAHRDSSGRPDEYLVQRWFVMVFGELKALILKEAKPYVDAARDWLRDLIGYVRSGFGSLGSWLDTVERRIGYSLPSWASSVAMGLVNLWNRLPVSIREAWESWDQLWERIKESVRAWARARYDAAKGWALDALNWINYVGQAIRSWYDRAHSFLDRLRGDPYGVVAGWLGWAWGWLRNFASHGRDVVFGWLGPDFPRLLTFARDCVQFYYNLWSRGWYELSEFVDHPRWYILDRLEEILERLW